MTEQDQEAEKEKARAWIQFLIQTYTAPTFGETDPAFDEAKKDFIEIIKPKTPEKKYEWDEDVLNKYKALQ